MYNDYYLQIIDSKMDSLQTIINNQSLIIDSQNVLIQDQLNFERNLYTILIWLIIFVWSYIFYMYYHHIFRDYK